MKSTTKAATAVVGMLLLALGLATPAAAAYKFEYKTVVAESWSAGEYFCTNNGTPTGATAVGCFAPNGDDILAGDLKTDQRRIGVEYRTSYGRHGLCVNAGGTDAKSGIQGSGVGSSGKHRCKLDFKENTKVTYRVGRCNGSAVNCAVLSNYTNWSAAITRSTSG